MLKFIHKDINNHQDKNKFLEIKLCKIQIYLNKNSKRYKECNNKYHHKIKIPHNKYTYKLIHRNNNSKFRRTFNNKVKDSKGHKQSININKISNSLIKNNINNNFNIKIKKALRKGINKFTIHRDNYSMVNNNSINQDRDYKSNKMRKYKSIKTLLKKNHLPKNIRMFKESHLPNKN